MARSAQEGRFAMFAAAIALAVAGALLVTKCTGGTGIGGTGPGPDAAAPPTPPGAAAGDETDPARTAPGSQRSPIPEADEATNPRDTQPVDPAGPGARGSHDELVFLVRESDGAPAAAMAIRIQWLHPEVPRRRSASGWTDAAGRFASTLQDLAAVSSVHLQHPRCGEIGCDGTLLPSAADESTVLLAAPELATLRLSFVDVDGRPVPGVRADVLGAGTDGAPRESLLLPAASKGTADGTGTVEALVPVGWCSVSVTAPAGYATPKHRPIRLVSGGTSATLLLLQKASRRDVPVRVTLPAGIDARPSLFARGRIPDEELARRMHVDTTEPSIPLDVTPRRDHFVVHADPLPWRLHVGAIGCKGAAIDLQGDEPEVHVALQREPPPPPQAHVVVEVLAPDGSRSARADVRLHDRPDLIHGYGGSTDEDGRYTFRSEPGRRVCFSARTNEFAPVVAGPFELAPGELHVLLQLRESRTVRGVVVDEEGRPCEAHVTLHRPTGALAGLGEDVAPVLEVAIHYDERGTLEDGRFAFDDVGPGTHEIRAISYDRTQLPGRVRVFGETEVTVRLGHGLDGLCMLSIEVVDEATAAPMPSCTVQHHGVTDANGVVRATLSPQDGYVVQCGANGYAVTRSGPHRLAPGAQRITVRMARSRPVFVRVADADGAPLPGKYVGAIDAEGEWLPAMDARGSMDHVHSVATTDARGRGVLFGLPEGALRMRVVRHEFELPAGRGRDDVFEVRLPR